MRVLVACEESQTVCKAFRAKGHEAYSCDIIGCSGGHPEWHIKDDVLKHLNDGWDLMIAHPPCTYLSNSGVRWLHERPERWDDLRGAINFFNRLIHARILHIAIENPIQHKYARWEIGKYDQIIQPHHFIGSNESKATCLWLKCLPKLQRTQWLDKSEIKQTVFRMPPSETRGLERSRFPLSIAQAMATQWG